MNLNNKNENPEQEILSPDSGKHTESSASNYFLAQVSNYTNRPDLLIAEIEKHDPGFVKRMNEASEKHANLLRDERFRFGKIQAYCALGVSVFAAPALLLIIGLAVWRDQGFASYIALGLVYAITQGGSRGFVRLVDGVREWISGKKKKDDAE